MVVTVVFVVVVAIVFVMVVVGARVRRSCGCLRPAAVGVVIAVVAAASRSQQHEREKDGDQPPSLPCGGHHEVPSRVIHANENRRLISRFPTTRAARRSRPHRDRSPLRRRVPAFQRAIRPCWGCRCR
ncbi:MAG: hypothetical protein F4070_08180 [Acidimicrobiales bacterium]|nr:hypothetical protein [Acidimicrobiales bacterium]